MFIFTQNRKLAFFSSDKVTLPFSITPVLKLKMSANLVIREKLLTIPFSFQVAIISCAIHTFIFIPVF